MIFIIKEKSYFILSQPQIQINLIEGIENCFIISDQLNMFKILLRVDLQF